MKKSDIYIWEIEFDDGTKMNRNQWLASAPKGKRMDPNDPDKQARFVRLLPLKEGFSEVETIKLPKGAKPVVVIRDWDIEDVLGNQSVKSVCSKIGFSFKGVRHMISVNWETKKVKQEIDGRGRK